MASACTAIETAWLSLGGPRVTRRRSSKLIFLSARATAPIFPADCGRYSTNANFAGDAILWLCGKRHAERKIRDSSLRSRMIQKRTASGRVGERKEPNPFPSGKGNRTRTERIGAGILRYALNYTGNRKRT